MAILKVARPGHPVLRKVAEAVSVREIRSGELQLAAGMNTVGDLAL